MEWLRDHAWETWLGLTIVLGVAEMFSLDLILIMLAAGALVSMIAAVLDLHIAIQVLAASAASLKARAAAPAPCSGCRPRSSRSPTCPRQRPRSPAPGAGR